MKTKRNLYCLFVPLLLLSACVVTQIPDIQPTQTLIPTSIPVTETAGSDMNRIITTPTHVPGPIVAQIGDLTMEVYEFAMFQPRPDEGRTFNTTAGPSSEILKNRRPLRDVFAQPFSPHEPSNMPTFCSNRIAVRLAPIGPIAKSANRLMWLH